MSERSLTLLVTLPTLLSQDIPDLTPIPPRFSKPRGPVEESTITLVPKLAEIDSELPVEEPTDSIITNGGVVEEIANRD
ncbi:hypothetical protein G9A89_009804 [Geosiphon pyriformis]|nr:hypothetical protein G9A89_009804 [Geosiphon pyriformis]